MAKITLHELKKKLAADYVPEKLDFGYCIPDCANCCPHGLCMDPFTVTVVAKKLGVVLDSIIDEIDNSGRCGFLNDYSLCIIHDMKERNTACTTFGPVNCHLYQITEELENYGCNIKSELREIWLERLKKDYDKEKWVDEAAQYIMKRAEDFISSKTKSLPA